MSFTELVDPAPPTPLILVEEISHRVVNEYTQAIASIRLAAASTASLEAQATLRRAANRLLRFAEAHRVLQAPPRTGYADLGVYLERVGAAMAAASLGDSRIRLTVSTTPIELPMDRCWRVALIVAELITNAARHGLRTGCGHIRVDLELIDDRVVCRVGDDGGAVIEPQPARGRHVVEALASDLGGVARWLFRRDGVTVELVFPLEVGA